VFVIETTQARQCLTRLPLGLTGGVLPPPAEA
jgi:hypothetical protein